MTMHRHVPVRIEWMSFAGMPPATAPELQPLVAGTAGPSVADAGFTSSLVANGPGYSFAHEVSALSLYTVLGTAYHLRFLKLHFQRLGEATKARQTDDSACTHADYKYTLALITRLLRAGTVFR